eukprot:gene60079-82202_t
MISSKRSSSKFTRNPAPLRALCHGVVLACALLAGGNALAQKPHQG